MAYGRQGYINASVKTDYTYKQVEPKIDITYDIRENERFFIEKVLISGNDKTKDTVIRRELLFFLENGSILKKFISAKKD